MSFILDALKRADRERGQGTLALPSPGVVPDASVPPVPPQRATWRLWALAAAALVAVGAALGWLGSGAHSDARVNHLPTTTAVPAASAPSVAPALASTPVPPVPTTAAAPFLPPPGPLPARPPVVAPAPFMPAAVASSAPTAATRGNAPIAEPTAATPTSSQSAAPAAAEPVLQQHALPPEIRQQLPTLKLGGSIYSPRRADRLLVVDGQVAHEGDTIAPDVVLDQIRQRSAIFRFRQYRFEVQY